jgi:hypothetical protein
MPQNGSSLRSKDIEITDKGIGHCLSRSKFVLDIEVVDDKGRWDETWNAKKGKIENATRRGSNVLQA